MECVVAVDDMVLCLAMRTRGRIDDRKAAAREDNAESIDIDRLIGLRGGQYKTHCPSR